MSEVPEPLTPPDCDLRGLPFMPMDTIRVLDSDLFAVSTGDEFKAAFALWCKAWQQIPAGSLPDDDRVLAHLSGAGARWRKVKATALRNWVKCADGRLYHPTVAEKALEALPARQEYKEKRSTEADRKEREREDRKRMFQELRAAGVTPKWDIKTSELRDLHAQHVTPPVTEPVTPVTEQVTAKTGKGKGTESYDVVGGHAPACAREDPPFPADLIELTQAVCRAGGIRHAEPGPIVAHQRIVQGWLTDGFDPLLDIQAGLKVGLARAARDGERISSPRFFDHDIRQTHARRLAGIEETSHVNGSRPGRRPSRADEIDQAATDLGFGQ